MFRNFFKGVVEGWRWRWLTIEDCLEWISNVTIRTIVTALGFVVSTVIADVLFGWFHVIIYLNSKTVRQFYDRVYEEAAEKYDTVLSWKEEP